MTTPSFGLLFHFTHLDNLPAILDAGALLSDKVVEEQGLLVTEAGDPTIKRRRRNQPVSCYPGSYVGDYVPFYFAARSPMMYVLSKGNVPSFTGDHRDLVYFVGEVNRLVDAGVDFAISDRNAAKAYAEFSNDVTVLGDLAARVPESAFIDWPLMNEKNWQNTADDPARMERRMAEFLVHRKVGLDLLAEVAVHSCDRKAIVKHMFEDAGCTLEVVVRPDWYYS